MACEIKIGFPKSRFYVFRAVPVASPKKSLQVFSILIYCRKSILDVHWHKSSHCILAIHSGFHKSDKFLWLGRDGGEADLMFLKLVSKRIVNWLMRCRFLSSFFPLQLESHLWFLQKYIFYKEGETFFLVTSNIIMSQILTLFRRYEDFPSQY